MKRLRPLSGHILIEPLDEEDQKTSSGLILPEKAKEKPAKGKVINFGPPIIHYETYIPMQSYLKANNYPEEKCPVKIGDIVIYHRWSGQDVKEGNKEYKLVQFKDLMGVYE